MCLCQGRLSRGTSQRTRATRQWICRASTWPVSATGTRPRRAAHARPGTSATSPAPCRPSPDCRHPRPAGRRQPTCRRIAPRRIAARRIAPRRIAARRIAPRRAGCRGGTLAFIRGRLRTRPRPRPTGHRPTGHRPTGHRSRPNRCRAAGRTQAAIRMPAVIRTPGRLATTANRGACSGRRRQRTATGARPAIVARSKQTPATAWAAIARCTRRSPRNFRASARRPAGRRRPVPAGRPARTRGSA